MRASDGYKNVEINLPVMIYKNSAEGYVPPGKEHVSVTYSCNSYS